MTKIILCALLIPLSAITAIGAEAHTATQIKTLKAKLSNNEIVADIDHHQLAKDAGVTMPPCRLLIFNHAKKILPIIASNPKAAIDLPYRYIAYLEGEQAQSLTTDSSWLKARFALEGINSELQQFDSELSTLGISKDAHVGAKMHDGSPLTEDFALLTQVSDFDFPTSKKRLKDSIMSQGDTVWFGSIDFQKLAKEQGITLPPCTLLLFGGPAPGGVAMAKFPKLGLDAFCQKVLLLENDGKTTLYYNSIEKLAEFHYGTSSEPHQQLDKRIGATYLKALKK